MEYLITTHPVSQGPDPGHATSLCKSVLRYGYIYFEVISCFFLLKQLCASGY